MNRAFLILFTAIVLACLVYATWFGYGIYAHGKHDLNGALINNLARVLEHEKLVLASIDTLEPVLAKYNLGKRDLRDAWNRPLKVASKLDPDGSYHYFVASYGADRRPGPCSISSPHCKTSDGDWIYRDGSFTAQ